MALISCPDCGGKLSTQASACPHCGRPVTVNETQSIGSKAATNIGPCPDLPADLSIGSQVTNWFGDAAFDGYFNSEENAMPNYASGNVHIILHKKGINIAGKMYQSFLKIHNQQIINSQAVKRTALIQESKSVAGRAMVGGLILGPVGAIVGGLTGLGTAPTAYDGCLVVNYWDSDSRTPRTLIVAGPWCKIDKFCSRLLELRNKKEKGMITNEVFIAAKSKFLNRQNEDAKAAIHDEPAKANAADNTTPPYAKNYKVKIKGPDDSKKMYLATKAFYKDADVTFEKAKAFLMQGVIMTFEDKEDALQFAEKYKQMECKAELQDNK